MAFFVTSLCKKSFAVQGHGEIRNDVKISWNVNSKTVCWNKKKCMGENREPEVDREKDGGGMNEWVVTVCVSWQVVKDLVTIFPVLRDWLADFLSQNCTMTASMIGRNLLIEQV